jgi:hypothetical protein
MNKIIVGMALIAAAVSVACNNGLSLGGRDEPGRKRDKSQKTVIDDAVYVDFTVKKYNAHTVKIEDMVHTLGGMTYKNGNSSMVINSQEGTIELSSDEGTFNGKRGCQIYGVFEFDILAASEDCLYIRKNPRGKGYILIDGMVYRDDAIPDLGVCLPLYGYSRNRIEVSSVMNGYIIMPSGTYWKK